MSKTVSTLFLIVLLAGYGGVGKAQERLARDSPSWKTNAVEKERERREFWQGLAFFGCAGSVIFLIVGVAMGSATIRKQRGGGRVFKP